MADDACAPIKVDVADWLIKNTLLSKLPAAGQDLLKAAFPAPGAGKVTGKLCLVANSQSAACKKSEKAEVDCCKFTAGTLHLAVMDMPDKVTFSIPAAPGVDAVSVDLTLSGQNDQIHVNEGCKPPTCKSEKATAHAHLRVDGQLTLGGMTFKIGVPLDLQKKLELECGE